MLKKVLEKIIDNFVFSLVIGIFLPTIISVVSKFNTGNWFNYAKSIPRIYWIMFAVIICIWLLASIIYRRKKLVDELNSDSLIGFYAVPAYGWIKVGEIQYAELLWNSRIMPTIAPDPFFTELIRHKVSFYKGIRKKNYLTNNQRLKVRFLSPAPMKNLQNRNGSEDFC